MQQRETPKVGERVFRVPRGGAWEVLLPLVQRPKPGSLPVATIVYTFAGVIVLGAALLMLPISTSTGKPPHPVDAFFTATSAVCVTGLVVVDTGTYWSFFGQIVTLVLIQLGGLGIMTSGILFLLAVRRRIGLRTILLLRDSMGLTKLGDVAKVVKRMVIFSLLVEGIGAVAFYFRFAAENAPETAVWRSIYQSVSAFNNAGLDIFGNFRSLLDYQGDLWILLVTAALIILGGLSYLVIADVVAVRRFSRLSVDSKLVLVATGALLVVGTIVILLTEFANPATLGALPWPHRVLDSFFQSVTARTAGFTTIDLGRARDYTLFFTMLLMFIGGASGSTAGGIKVNTIALLSATMWGSLTGKEHIGAFGREFSIQQIHRALVVVMLSVGLVGIVVFVLTMIESFSFLSLLFETFSAFGTVGLSAGITPGLTIAGRLIICVTMFVGRLGPLTLALSLVQRQQPAAYRYPQEMVRIG